MTTDLFSYLSGWVIAGWLGGGHCLAMCGGLGLAAGLNNQRPKAWLNLLLMNFGRLTSYILVGALLGFLIDFAYWLGIGVALQKLLYLASLILIAGMGAYIAGRASWFNRIEVVGQLIWPHIKPYWQSALPIRTPRQAIIAGLVWGWLPCGLVYTAALAAMASGSALKGALTMLAFGCGTLPNLLAIGMASQWVAKWRKDARVRIISGTLLIFYAIHGLLNLLR